jgi:hypothetical protein
MAKHMSKRHRIYFLVSNSYHQISLVEWEARVHTLNAAHGKYGIDQAAEWADAVKHYAASGRDLGHLDVVMVQYAPNPGGCEAHRIVMLEDVPYISHGGLEFEEQRQMRDDAVNNLDLAKMWNR